MSQLWLHPVQLLHDVIWQGLESRDLELELEPRQVEEGILCLFHSVLFHRTTGKFSYKDSCSYHINALGYEDVDCDYIDHTYLRTHSATLTQLLATEVGNFGTELRAAGRGIGSGQVHKSLFVRSESSYSMDGTHL